MNEWRSGAVTATLGAIATVVAATITLAGCSSLTEGQANQTLPPLTLPGPTAAPVTQPHVPNTQGTIATTTVPLAADIAPDNGDPVSVAARFLSSVSSGDRTTATLLEADGRSPTVFDWAASAYQEYTGAAGAGVWGQPTCLDPVGAAPTPVTVSCTWLSTPDAPSLVLVDDAGTWKVSHAAVTPDTGAEPAVVGQACVLGNDNVNFRGGPGKDWPRFGQIPIGSCDVTVFDVVESEPSTGAQWRYVEYGGQRGWMVDRAVRVQ